MKKAVKVFVLVTFVACLALAGCTPKAADSSDAINQAKALQTTEQQIDYLIKQANAFINSKEFDQAINTAQYILSNLDSNSNEAKSIIDLAKAEMTKAAQGAAANVANKLGSFGQ